MGVPEDCQNCQGLKVISREVFPETEVDLVANGEPGIRNALQDFSIGDIIHVFYYRWYEAEVRLVYTTTSGQELKCEAPGPSGIMRVFRFTNDKVIYNSYRSRYEHFSAGTTKAADVQAVPKAGMSPPTAKLKVGDTVHVFDAEWFNTVVDSFYLTTRNQGMARVSYGIGVFRGDMQMLTQSICWNLTKDRWEYIRAGTPVC